MRQTFAEFYPRDPGRLAELARKAVIVPDAEVLLGLYRSHRTGRTQVLEALSAARDRLWLPFHTGLIFQEQRARTIREVLDWLDAIRVLPAQALAEPIERRVDELGLPAELHPALERVLTELAGNLATVEELHDSAMSRLIDSFVPASAIDGDDPVRNAIDELFAGRVGAPMASVPEGTPPVWAELEAAAELIAPDRVPLLLLLAPGQPAPAELLMRLRELNPAGAHAVAVTDLVATLRAVVGTPGATAPPPPESRSPHGTDSGRHRA